MINLPEPWHTIYDRALEYIRRVLVGVDEFANVLLNGVPGDTLSYRGAKAQAEGKIIGCAFCRLLDLFQKDHCKITMQSYDAQALADAASIERGGHAT